MTPHNLPQNWQWVKLGEIAEIIGGTTPSTTNPEYWNGEFYWITPAEIHNDSKTIYTTKRQITQKAIKDKSLRILPIGTVLLSSRAPIGKVAIAGSEMCCNQGFKNLVCDEKKIYNLYLFYFLKGKTTFLNSLGRGTTFKEISKSIVEEIKIPLPPLEIQREIVEILESKLEKIKEAKALLETSLQECETYRLSLLESAFSGNLTPHSQNWQWVELKKLARFKNGFAFKSNLFSEKGDPIIRIQNIQNETISLENLVYLNPLDYKQDLTKYIIQQNDILIAMSGATTGKIGIYNLPQTAYLNQRVGIIRIDSEILRKYIFYFLTTQSKKNLERSLGTAQPNLSTEQIQTMQIPLPPLEIQREIVEILESKLEKIKEAKALLETSLQECETYRLSLLESAFAGELV